MKAKAVLVLAGWGTRLLPASKACSKELLPLTNRPIINYLIEEVLSCGISEIILIVGRNQEALENYLKPDRKLDAVLRSKGQSALLKELREFQSRAKFRFVKQKEARGDGDAILCAAKAIGKSSALVLFGDDLIDGPLSAAQQLKQVYGQFNCPVLSLERVPDSELHRYGVVGGQQIRSGLWALEQFKEKPALSEAPSNLAVIGKYWITPEVLQILKKIPRRPGRELKLIDAFEKMAAAKQKIVGLELSGRRFDTGNPAGYAKAFLYYAQKDPALRAELKS